MAQKWEFAAKGHKIRRNSKIPSKQFLFCLLKIFHLENNFFFLLVLFFPPLTIKKGERICSFSVVENEIIAKEKWLWLNDEVSVFCGIEEIVKRIFQGVHTQEISCISGNFLHFRKSGNIRKFLDLALKLQGFGEKLVQNSIFDV